MLFYIIAEPPKTTVQAASGNQVLAMSVIVIVITALHVTTLIEKTSDNLCANDAA